jgi:hypothetical protein
MATINLIDLLGTDNVALSRTDINKNFQTVENSINTLEGFLDTTPAGGTLSIGSIAYTLGANPIATVLSNNAGSALIQGNLTINQDLTVTGATAFGADISVANKLLVTGAGGTAGIVVGDAGPVPITLRLGTYFLDESIAAAIADASVTEENTGLLTSSIHDIATAGLSAILLDYSLIATAVNKASVIRLPAGVVGQKLMINILAHGDPAGTNPTIWIHAANMNSMYNTANSGADLAAGAAYDNVNTLTIPVALGITGTTSEDYQRKNIELIYKSTGWEVFQSHPSIDGL